MPVDFKILYFFESTNLFIVEVKRLDLPDTADLADIYQWLHIDRESGKLLELSFNSMNSSPENEERYFAQGYLKFNTTEATFIEKHHSDEHHLINKTEHAPNNQIMTFLIDYFS